MLCVRTAERAVCWRRATVRDLKSGFFAPIGHNLRLLYIGFAKGRHPVWSGPVVFPCRVCCPCEEWRAHT